MDTALRVATIADLSTLLTMQTDCPGAPQWTESIWYRVLAGLANERMVLLAEERSVTVGFVVVGLAAGIASLESIAVSLSARGRGIGRALGLAAMQWACTHGADAMELEVRAANAAALQLYQRLGFVEQGRRRAYYMAPVEDAVLMGIPLSGIAARIAKV
jgi:ribosomal-protein-alanine N-acetyltransferase